jgi:hypothetical protein
MVGLTCAVMALWPEMEKIMSKTNDTSNLEHGRLADSELDAVTGGSPSGGIGAGKVTFEQFRITRRIDTAS